LTKPNTNFVQKIFHITQSERKTNVQRHSQADGLRARFKLPKSGVFCHFADSTNTPCSLQPSLIWQCRR